jgi:putative ABC transport system permease protein
MWSRLRAIARAVFARRKFEDGLDEEVRFHVDRYVDDLVRGGVPREEATRIARLEFGNVDTVRSDCREARGLRLLDEVTQDVRHALRLMRRAPGFTVTALATLALCLGATLTIFAVVDAVLLQPLPFPEASRLVTIYNTYPKAGVPDDGASLTNYYERRGHIAAFSSIAIYRDDAVIVGETGATEREFVTRVSPGFFATLGVGPALGREFTEAETTYDTAASVILTDAYWRHKFDADPQVVGRTLRVDGFAVTIVGVLPREFTFLSSKRDLYFPLPSAAEERGPDRRHSGNSTRMIARLAPGSTIAAAQAQIDAHNAALERTNPQAQFIAEAGFRSIVVSLHDKEVAAIRPTLLLLQAGVLLLLLIGAVNVTNLLLIRASSRTRELAIRQAIGAGRQRVVREVLVETTVLTVVGGLLGVCVGLAGIRLLSVVSASQLPHNAHVSVDVRVALVAALIAVIEGLLIGIAIAWYHLGSEPQQGLTSESRGGTTAPAAQRLRYAFVVAQVALAFTLLAGSGLLALSLKQVMAVESGFRPDGVLTGQVALPWKNYQDDASKLSFIGRLVEELTRQPGVRAAGISTNVPFSGNANKSAVTVKGYRRPPGEPPRGIYSYAVGGNYFAALGYSLREGRFLTAKDLRPAARSCIVDANLARHYWPRGGALGHHLFLGSEEGPDAEAFTVVGVVSPVKQAGLTDTDQLGAVYYPYSGRFDSSLYVVVRTSVPPETIAASLQRIVRAIDPELPVNNIKSMDTRIAESLVVRRSPAVLAGVFAGIALLLTAIGTYGVLSYAVVQRRREIGLRIALGARPAQIARQFLGIASRLLLAGTLLGIAAAWASGRAMQSLLFEVPPFHGPTLAAVGAVMTVICLAACLLPSRHAAGVSPMEALTDE